MNCCSCILCSYPSSPHSSPHTFRMLHLYRKLGKAIDQLDYFVRNEWKVSHCAIDTRGEGEGGGCYCTWRRYFHSPCILTCSFPFLLPPSSSLLPPLQWSHTNHDKLLSVMHKEDKKEFGFDIRDLDWDQYIKDYCLGTKQYLFNEDLTNVPIARRQIKR